MAIVPPNPLLHLALAGWSASTDAGRDASDGHADSALLDLGLSQPGTLDVTAGRASSNTSRSRAGSTATSETDGLRAGLGGGAVRLVVLHSEATNHGHCRAYLVSANGTVLGGSEEMERGRPITVPRTVTLHLLHGGADDAEGAAARDGRSQGVMGLSSGSTGDGRSTQPEPLS